MVLDRAIKHLYHKIHLGQFSCDKQGCKLQAQSDIDFALVCISVKLRETPNLQWNKRRIQTFISACVCVHAHTEASVT